MFRQTIENKRNDIRALNGLVQGDLHEKKSSASSEDRTTGPQLGSRPQFGRSSPLTTVRSKCSLASNYGAPAP